MLYSGQPAFHRDQDFRINTNVTYSERMTQTRSELRRLVRESLCENIAYPT